MHPQLGYYVAKVIGKLKGDKNKETINKWFLKKGVIFIGGNNIHINSNIAINEPHLISIGDGTTIAGNVEFITHDNSISKVIEGATDLYGKITIGKNCFIGARAILMYGITIADNVIVAAGSVVTHSVTDSYVIIAGNPAHVIGTWDNYREKSKGLYWNMNETTREEMISRTSRGERVVTR